MSFPELVQPLVERKDLSQVQAVELMRFLMSGKATEAQIGGVLLGFRIKGCTTRELAAFASVIREHAAAITHEGDDLVDTCGTGGGIPSFNISTAAAIIASAAGAKIAKHGNRGVTSACGSADVLEHLGIEIIGDPEELSHILEAHGIVFLFAQAHHPAIRFVGKARKELGLRTVFNQLGPLANPAGATRQLIGVYDAALMRSMGEALNLLGSRRALIVNGTDGLDEISPCVDTEFVRVWEGRVSAGRFGPKDFGLTACDPSALSPGKDCAESADILREAISDLDSPRAAVVLPSASAAIWLSGLEESLPASTDRAKMAISSGRALQKLEELAVATKGE